MTYGDTDLGQHWLRLWLVILRYQAITWTSAEVFRPSDNQLRPNSQALKIIWKMSHLKFNSNIQISHLPIRCTNLPSPSSIYPRHAHWFCCCCCCWGGVGWGVGGVGEDRCIWIRYHLHLDWDCRGSWNPASLDTMTHLSDMVTCSLRNQRSQVISRHDFGLVDPKYSDLETTRFKLDFHILGLCLDNCETNVQINQGVVSLTFRVLSKIISRKYTMPETTFMVRISSWNYARVPKAWNSHRKYDFCNTQISREYIWELAKR